MYFGGLRTALKVVKVLLVFRAKATTTKNMPDPRIALTLDDSSRVPIEEPQRC
jgi:hypothetical protein